MNQLDRMLAQAAGDLTAEFLPDLADQSLHLLSALLVLSKTGAPA
jgi:hypothetical protein